ncbi:Gfo/Idh/MocA family oxidoreductase [Parenemella sanctibonifatiensis]|uniref:Gfo/Idh/MocA family oxidoreductase n=1 Tax=Parenemella sanctibonifatiensis TaxID=2016505 RepID=UPI001E3C3265|nr:Gfo/Idh/MocA family oxidoreductase [Parenemella sanctibonifatiensis]
MEYPVEKPLWLYDEAIDVEDTYSAVIGYAGGVQATYSIDFSSPWEGATIGISGTAGRLEMRTGRLADRSPLPHGEYAWWLPLFGEPQPIEVPAVSENGHAAPMD